MVASKWSDSPAAWVGFAFLAGLVGVLGGVWFSSADVITSGDDTNNTGEVTAGQTIGLVLQTYFVPLGLALWMMAAPELVKQPMAPGAKLLALATAEAFFVAGAVYEWRANAWQLLNCGVVFCIWESVDDDGYTSYSKKPYLYVTAAAYVVGCLYAFALLLPATLRAAALAWRVGRSDAGAEALWNYDASSEAAAYAERSPLLGAEGSLDAAAAAAAEGKGPAQAEAWAADFLAAQDSRLGRQRGCLCCALGVLFPACFLLATVLPDTWYSFNRQGIQELAQSPETDDGNYAGPVLSVAFGSAQGAAVYAKLWPDQLLFVWGLLLVACTALCLQPGKNQPFPKAAAALQARPPWLQFRLSSAGWTVGMALFLGAWATFLAALFGYWYALHGFDYESKTAMATSQRVARALGQCAVACLGLALLPASRTSVWPLVFGSGWEANVAVHQLFGYAVLGLGVAHALMWYVYYAQAGILSDWYTLNESSEWATDFTVNLMTVCFGVTLVCMGGLAMSWVRRSHFEWFYYAHVTAALGFTVAALWHAYDSLYYLLPALVLYLVDHARRFQHATRQVTVQSFAADPRTGVVTLSYALDGGPPSLSAQLGEWLQALGSALGTGGGSDGGTAITTSAGQPLRCEAGQYVFLKVPALSLTESHPFTISSAPGDALTSHHIRPMPPAASSALGAPPSFTARLAALARDMHAAGQPPRTLEVSVEGPYGVAIDYLSRYDAVLFIGGGIGVTPVHAAFRSLLRLQREGGGQASQHGGSGGKASGASEAVPGSVRLVWAARTPALLDLFGATWRSAEVANVQPPPAARPPAAAAAAGASANPQDQGSVDHELKGGVPGFSCALWCSKPDQAERGSSGGDGSSSSSSNNATSTAAVGPFAAAAGSAPLAWARGRPDYRAEVASLAGYGARALVFVCHVPAVVDQCAALAAEFGAELHAETFAL